MERLRVILALILLIGTLVSSSLLIDESTPSVPETTTSPSPLPSQPEPSMPRIIVPRAGFTSWYFYDKETGRAYGSSNAAKSQRTASMTKVWIAADYLRRNPMPSQIALARLRIMIRDSDNNVASYYWFGALGGSKSFARMKTICKLTDSYHNFDWARMMLSTRDSVRLGQCIDNGKAGGKWTAWILNEMRQVRGVGDFGIRNAVSADEYKRVAIKNGWSSWDGRTYHVRCLAIAPKWIMAVTVVYPGYNLNHGAAVCRSVAKQVLSKR